MSILVQFTIFLHPQMRYIFLLALLAIVNGSYSQTPLTFVPAAEDEAKLSTELSDAEMRYKETVAKLPSTYKKDYQDIYKLRWENIKTKFDNKEIYTETAAAQYLQSLVDEIVRANPLLQGKTFKCYFSRSGVPNASYIGEGIILFHMGLFQRLENESQAAFIIGHELAHFLLQHSENGIDKYVTTVNSEEVKKEIKKIQKSEFRVFGQLEKLVKNVTFNHIRHGREHEREADSLSVELLRHTRFQINEAITTLNLLDKIDTDTLQTAETLQRLFHSKDYPFQKKWLRKEEGLLGGHAIIKDDEELADSLKTHPDCKARVEYLKPVIEKYQQVNAVINVINPSTFDSLKQVFRYEIIAFTFGAKNYTRSLFYTIELLQHYPNNPYLVSMVGNIFNAFYAAQKAHTLTHYIDFPKPQFPSNYNLLLQFIQNLYAENYASISYHYLKQFQLLMSDYGDYKTAYQKSIQIAQE